MDLVTGAMGSLLPKLGELLKEEYGLQKGVRKKIETLSRELEAAHAVLRRIGDVPPEQLDDLVRLWARDVREASYDMEDIVDTFLVRVDEPADPNRLRRLRKKVGGLFKKSKARRKISCLIQDIYEKLEEVAARRGRYSLDSIVAKPAAATSIDPRILNLFKRATELVGIEGPRDELINKLSLAGDVDMPRKKAIKVISVVGFGGLGKTTLAKAVYNQLKPQFERSAFVPVGRNPDVKKVLRDILIDLDSRKYANSDLMVLDEKQLMEELEEFIKEKRCFIVIDDIWDKESWKLIRCALQNGHCGSRVVVTTRTYEVAAETDEEYKIQPLSRDNSGKLLYARIADSEGKYFDSPSTEACDKILKKCGGVPLAIITIASLLASKPWEDWSEVYNSIGFGQGGNDYVDNTRKILSFSYYDLPSHLKPCLLYLSIFSEDQLIRKNNLIWMWVAEGFVHEEQAEGIELFELGERYFNELINRSMIQPVERFKGYVDCCRVHDMVFDLVRSLSSQENFVTVLDGNDERQELSGSIARRIALQRIEQRSGSQLLANVDVDKARSFIASECNFGLSSCPRTPVLRVLDMQDCYVGEKIHEGMLDHLGSLLHLRYLRLESSVGKTNIKLPREVRYLKFLQTLDLWKFRINELPEEVGLLTQLVCLRVGRRTRTPDGLIGKLTSLQELVGWPPDDDDYDDARRMQFVKELGMLRELRVLWTEIYIRDESMVRALLESLGNLHNIRMMHINGLPLYVDKCMTSHEGFITCRHLQFLYLNCLVFSGLPKWIKSSLAPNLSYLYVRVQTVKEQDMETLGRLPELRSLTLTLCDETKLVNIKIPCTAQGVGYYFRKLKILEIGGAPIWFDLRDCVSSGSVASAIMPTLESLEFKVSVRFLKDASLLSLGRLLGFERLGRTSLQRVTVTVNCGGARISDVGDVEDALELTAAVHPKRPNLRTTRQQEEEMFSSTYQEACMDVSRTPDFVLKAWKSADIVDSGHIRALRIPPDPEASSTKVLHLLYANKGKYLLTLSSNAILKQWKWEPSEKNPRGRPTTSVPPVPWKPKEGILMTNDTTEANTGAAAACIALSKNESYIISASGGKVSLFNAKTFKVMTTFMAPPPASTSLAFYPQDNNIIAIGMEDSSIKIYQARKNEVQRVLMGHQKKVTGLTFSQSMNVLVSSGADAQLCVWSTDNWENKKSRYIQPPSNGSALVGDTMVQFHYDQTHLLVVHESQLAIYDAELECLHSWSPRDALPSPISSAVYTSDGLLVYAGFRDGAIGIFEAESLRIQCRIAPSAYIPSSVPSGGGIVYPMAVSVYPWLNPNQIALGMSDGAVYVLEPLED